ncbi:hypothetical protein KM043_012295 [Ampulex compressa]|nr:hypothetical protein KM043_012295 [Ampulex compressa]
MGDRAPGRALDEQVFIDRVVAPEDFRPRALAHRRSSRSQAKTMVAARRDGGRWVSSMTELGGENLGEHANWRGSRNAYLRRGTRAVETVTP